MFIIVGFSIPTMPNKIWDVIWENNVRIYLFSQVMFPYSNIFKLQRGTPGQTCNFHDSTTCQSKTFIMVAFIFIIYSLNCSNEN